MVAAKFAYSFQGVKDILVLTELGKHLGRGVKAKYRKQFLKMMQQDVSQKKHIRKWEKWDLSGFHFQKNMVVREEIIYHRYEH